MLLIKKKETLNLHSAFLAIAILKNYFLENLVLELEPSEKITFKI